MSKLDRNSISRTFNLFTERHAGYLEFLQMKTSEFVFLHCFLEPRGKNSRIKKKTSNTYIKDTKGEHT